MKWLLLAIISIFLTLFGYGQSVSLRTKTLDKGQRIIILDSLPVEPSSIELTPNTAYKFYSLTNTLELSTFEDLPIKIKYRVLNSEISSEKVHYKKEDSVEYYTPYAKDDIEISEELFSSPGINKNGVLSRGISFGSKQDVFVNSNLNLQMDGELGDGIRLNAVISDQNVPFQPEGNTQNIQEFDQIFINLDHEKWSVKAGDLFVQKNDNYFMKYTKKTQGVHFSTHSKTDSTAVNSYATASLAKGKFNSMAVQPIEGVQGPYRLTGQNNEQFIIVVANTERVFLDGKPLKRGFEYDYIIDYNTAEVIFNNTIVITKFTRIRIDFEYTERNYSRAVYGFGYEQKSKKWQYGIDFFNEKDNKRQPLLGDLSLAEQAKLAEVGDSIQNAYVDGYFPYSEENFNQILYKKIDSAGITFFEYTPTTDSSAFVVIFTKTTNGDYVQKNSTVNGRVFVYVGKGLGDYLPVKVLPAPNKREMTVVKSSYSLNKNTALKSEFALSNKDKNLFSDSSDTDNYGTALLLGLDQKSNKINSNLNLDSKLDVQYQSKQFSSLDRIRDVDFDRDWGSKSATSSEEKQVNSSFLFKDSLNNSLNLYLNYRNKTNEVNGVQQGVNYAYNSGKYLNLNIKSFALENKTQTTQNQWRKLFFNPEFKVKKALLGYEFNVEKNRVKDIVNDSFLLPSMNYDENVFYIKTSDTTQGLAFYHRARKDYVPIKNTADWFQTKWKDLANTSTMEYRGNVGEHNRFKLTSSYRSLVSRDSAYVSLAPENSVLGRLDWNSNWLKRAISSDLVYNVNSSRELIKEVQFIGVLPSQGTHIWIDYDKDGVKDIDEFQEVVEGVAVNTDTLYAKFFIPTTEYRPAFTQNFNYRLNLKAPVSWRQKGKLLNLISRFDNTSFFIVEKKTQSKELNERLNPFIGSVSLNDDENTLFLRKNIRSTLFFNKTSPLYSVDITGLSQGNKNLLNYGQDGRYTRELNSNQRLTLCRKITLRNKFTSDEKQSLSTYLTSRNYSIVGLANESQVSFQAGNTLRYTFGYDYKSKLGEQNSALTKANIQNMYVELKVRQLANRTITAEFKYAKIKFDNSDALTPMAYEMLEALVPGNNFLWTFNLQQRMTNGLNLTFIYNGRKSENIPIIHTGSVQVSALF